MYGAEVVWLSTLGWIIISYCGCMVFDSLTLLRVGYAYVVPDGAPTIKPTLWSGWSLRHAVLVPIAILIQPMVRRHDIGGPVRLWVLGIATAIYVVLLFRDVMSQVRIPEDAS